MGGTWRTLVSSLEAGRLCAVVALLCVLLLLFCLLITASKKSSKLPPGPLALPIIGHMHLLGANLQRSLARLSNRYGPLIYLKLGSIPFVIASSPDAARQILQTFDQTFAFRGHFAAVEAIYGTSTGIIYSNPAPYWRYLRQLCATELFNLRRLEAYKPIRDEEVRALLQSIYYAADDAIDVPNKDSTNPCGLAQGVMRRSGASRPPAGAAKLVQLRPKLHMTANNIISRMAVGEAWQFVLPPVLEAVEAMSALNLGDFFPWIKWADLQGCAKRNKKAAQRMHAAFQGMIDRRREQREGVYEPPADILDILLSAALTCPKDLQITDAHIRAVLFDIFGAGADTSGVVVEWAMAELLANPREMRKVEEEIEDVVCREEGDKSNVVEEEDIQNMPYLRAVVKETLRLHPVVPLLVPRECGNACKIFGFDIPAKTQVIVNTWAIGRDPKVWDHPHDFHPKRFLQSDIDVRGLHFELLPFGSGRRVCAGLNLGLLNVHIILASLLHTFSWTPHDHKHDLSEKFGFLTTKAKPLLAKATPKMASQFYTGS